MIPGECPPHYWKPTAETPYSTEYLCLRCNRMSTYRTEIHTYTIQGLEFLVQYAPTDGMIVLREGPPR